MKSLPTITTVGKPSQGLSADKIELNGLVPTKKETARVYAVVDALRTRSADKTRLRIESRNPKASTARV